MKRRLPASPRALWYCSATLSADSTASEPPETNTMASSPLARQAGGAGEGVAVAVRDAFELAHDRRRDLPVPVTETVDRRPAGSIEVALAGAVKDVDPGVVRDLGKTAAAGPAPRPRCAAPRLSHIVRPDRHRRYSRGSRLSSEGR